MTRSKAASLLEKITRAIPGISGYQDRERRRDADKAVREKIASCLAGCRQRVSDRMNRLSRSGKKGGLGAIGRLENFNVLLERLEDEIRFAPRGYAGWFDREGVSLEDLEVLYEYDLTLLETAGGMEEAIPGGEPCGEESWLEGLERKLEALRLAFEKRASVMSRGEGKG